MYDAYLEHHGIAGQQWGKRNGPPYPLHGGAYSKTEVKAIKKKRRKKNSIYNKKHFDEVLSKDSTTLSTLSYDKDRIKKSDMFYASHNKLDNHQYNALFNKPIAKELFDEKGNSIGTGQCFKYQINNKLKRDMKVASEDSAADVFRNLYSKDRDFYNFVTDESRMQKHFVDSKYMYKGYRDSRHVLNKIRNKKNYTPTDKEVQTVYRMFNYVIPSDGGGNKRMAKDVATQRAKFFTALKKKGYGAVLDTNDGIYGSFKATSPVIVFDYSSIIPDSVKETNAKSIRKSRAILVGRKFLGA